jgi:predicted nucleic acid-binding protein
LADRKLTACYDTLIMAEYREVLLRPNFRFSKTEVEDVLNLIMDYGISVTPAPLDTFFSDAPDKAFYEVARFCHATLITGNKRHYPDEPLILTPVEFLRDF